MGKHQKLSEKVLRGDSAANIPFRGLCQLLVRLGFEERVRGSHHLFSRDGIEELINLQEDSAKAKPYQGQTSSGCHCEIRSDTRMKSHKYEIIIYWSDEDSAFVADVPELPGCAAHGASHEAALKQAQRAIDLWIDTARKLGRPIPAPKGRRLLLV